MAASLSACITETDESEIWFDEEATEYTPMLMARTELESSVGFVQPKSLGIPAKIYFKDRYVFISERYEGVHVIDNNNPAQPVNVGFITAPGCVDIAIKGQTLFVDNGPDLVAIDLTNLPQLMVTERIVNAFPEHNPPDLAYIPSHFFGENRPAGTVIIGWVKKN